jgi:hypothetical protein
MRCSLLVAGTRLVLAPLLLFALVARAADVDLRPHWDEQSPLSNPHKGWYHHFPDNHLDKYRIARDADLLGFPGMDHLYIRLAWAYLEPSEGKFNWSVIDDLIEKWTRHGLGIAFRISCKETSTDRPEQQFATPRWVMEAGAAGGYYRAGKSAGPDAPWEPVFDDPIFLQKLENFLKSFASRYDGQPWLRYVDIGSLGDWGEGHTWAGSRKEYGFEQRKPHVDLYLNYFKKSQLVISDDFVYGTGGPEERRRMHQYVMSHGISYRDDSILVDGYFAGHSATATVRSPEFFADVWKRLPTVLELEHYSAVKRSGNWQPSPTSSLGRHGGGRSGPDMLREALGLLHATYIGYHGDAADWLKDNPGLTIELLNRCGYWYFPRRIVVPDTFKAGEASFIEMTWENHGAAPASQPFQLVLRLDGPQTLTATLDARNRSWLPGGSDTAYKERYRLDVPARTRSGSYQLKLKLYSPAAGRDVMLALKPALLDSDRFYALGELKVVD